MGRYGETARKSRLISEKERKKELKNQFNHIEEKNGKQKLYHRFADERFLIFFYYYCCCCPRRRRCGKLDQHCSLQFHQFVSFFLLSSQPGGKDNILNSTQHCPEYVQSM